ncbi:hypothetical protein [Mycobacterium uberis]|uniref:hypothetical protein n=1 Tax=Mycobacterium uberis TaxID=2162698 RepID=UPI001FB417CD|nr:hypothetical protein [Mycobacterium uberis]
MCLQVLLVLDLRCVFMLIWNIMDVFAIAVPSGLIIACTRTTPRIWKMPLVIRLNAGILAGLRMSWSVSTVNNSGLIWAW